jgi:hypothetical protein
MLSSHSIPASLENRPWGSLGKQGCTPELNHAGIICNLCIGICDFILVFTSSVRAGGNHHPETDVAVAVDGRAADASG